MENFVCFGVFYFNNKKADIFNFLSVKYFGKRFFSKNLKCQGQLLWKLRPVELAILFHWT